MLKEEIHGYEFEETEPLVILRRKVNGDEIIQIGQHENVGPIVKFPGSDGKVHILPLYSVLKFIDFEAAGWELINDCVDDAEKARS